MLFAASIAYHEIFVSVVDRRQGQDRVLLHFKAIPETNATKEFI
jgi:hypothetical protein